MLNRIVRMAAAGGAGLAAYALACSRLGVAEVNHLLSRRREGA